MSLRSWNSGVDVFSVPPSRSVGSPSLCLSLFPIRGFFFRSKFISTSFCRLVSLFVEFSLVLGLKVD